MEWKKWGLSIGAVFLALFIVGFILSIISGEMQCRKMSSAVSAEQGAWWALYPTIVYALATYFEKVRNPFSGTLMSFGIAEDKAQVIGVGYLVMLVAWIVTVSNVHNTEQAVCVPDANEMAEFKDQMMQELLQKQQEQEQAATTPGTATATPVQS